jgi:hypothetical protein
MLQAQKDLELEIRRLKEVNERKITDEDMSAANKLKVKALEEEQRRMKRNVLLDSILTARAQIAVHSQEIERFVSHTLSRTVSRTSQQRSTLASTRSSNLR